MASLANTRLIDDWCLSNLICPKCHNKAWDNFKLKESNDYDFSIQCGKCKDCVHILGGHETPNSSAKPMRIQVSPAQLYDRLENFKGVFRYAYVYQDPFEGKVLSVMITEPITSSHFDEITEFGIPVRTPMYFQAPLK